MSTISTICFCLALFVCMPSELRSLSPQTETQPISELLHFIEHTDANSLHSSDIPSSTSSSKLPSFLASASSSTIGDEPSPGHPTVHKIFHYGHVLAHLREKAIVVLFFAILCVLFFIFSFIHHTLHIEYLEYIFYSLSLLTVLIYGFPQALRLLKEGASSLLHHIRHKSLPKTFNTEEIEHIIQCIVILSLIILPPILTQFNFDIVLDLALVAGMTSFVFFALHHLFDHLRDHKNYQSDILELWNTIPQEIRIVQFGSFHIDHLTTISQLQEYLDDHPTFSLEKTPIVINVSGCQTVPLIDGVIISDSTLEVNDHLVSGNYETKTKNQLDYVFAGSSFQSVDDDNSPILIQVKAINLETIIGRSFSSQEWDEEQHIKKRYTFMNLLPVIFFVTLLFFASIIFIALLSTDVISLHVTEGYSLLVKFLIVPLVLSIAICISPFVIGLPLSKTIIARYLNNHGITLSALPILFSSMPSFFALDINGTIVDHFEVKEFTSFSSKNHHLETLNILTSIQSKKTHNVYAQAVASFLQKSGYTINASLQDFDVKFDRTHGFSYVDINSERFVFAEINNLKGHHSRFQTYYPQSSFNQHLSDKWLFFKHPINQPTNITPLFSWSLKKDRLREGVQDFLEQLTSQHNITPLFITGATKTNAHSILSKINFHGDNPLAFCQVTTQQKATIIRFFKLYGKDLRPLIETLNQNNNYLTWEEFCSHLTSTAQATLWQKRIDTFENKKISWRERIRSSSVAYIGDDCNDIDALSESNNWSFSFQSEYHSSPLCRQQANILLKGNPDQYFKKVLFYLKLYKYSRSFCLFTLIFAVFYAIFSVIMVGVGGSPFAVLVHSVSEALTFVFPLLLIILFAFKSRKNRAKIRPFIRESFFIICAHKKIATYILMFILSTLSVILLAVLLPTSFKPLCLVAPIIVCIVLLPLLFIPTHSLDKRYKKQSFSDRIRPYRNNPSTSSNTQETTISFVEIPPIVLAPSVQAEEDLLAMYA